MKCPVCPDSKTKVIDSTDGDHNRHRYAPIQEAKAFASEVGLSPYQVRLRYCPDCGGRWPTVESLLEDLREFCD